MSDIKPQLEPGWLAYLQEEFSKDYFKNLKAFLVQEKANHQVYPAGKDIFNAFWLTPIDQLKVVILGQDPYHGTGQAHGLSFSVQKGVPIPPSLVNIFKELKQDLEIAPPAHGDLTSWARQGVLLLNATLTVRAHQAGSHQGKGWEQFTDSVIRTINDQCTGVIFLLWGNYAKAKAVLIDQQKHHVLTAAHPSPFSAYNGFFGCGHFSRANELLVQQGKEAIEWSLKER